jgi:hypothetical protein
VQRANELHLAERILDVCRELAVATNDQVGVTAGLLDRLALAATLGWYEDAERLFAAFQKREELPRHLYRPGAAAYHLARARFFRGRLKPDDLARGERLAADGRGVQNQHCFAALRAEWELGRGNALAARDAAEVALSVVRRTGESAADYLALRAHALARLGRASDAAESLAEAVRAWDGLLPRFALHAAEASHALGDTGAARDFFLRAHRCAWADGPPYAHHDYLTRCAERLEQLRIPEPRRKWFRADATAPVPFEAELRAVIERFDARKAHGGGRW